MTHTQGMVTHRELLADSVYRKWFARRPAEKPYTKWRVYVQKKRDKRWRRRDFDTWAEAYKFFKANWKDWYNAALVCRNGAYNPPVVRYRGQKQYYRKMIIMEAHRWCGYCRRPTMMGYFTRHHGFPKGGLQPMANQRRCGICGMREAELKVYR